MYLALHSVFYFILQENKTYLPQRMLTSGRVIKLGVSQTMEYIPVYWTKLRLHNFIQDMEKVRSLFQLA